MQWCNNENIIIFTGLFNRSCRYLRQCGAGVVGTQKRHFPWSDVVIWVLVFFSFTMPSDVLIMEAFKLPYEFRTLNECISTENAFHEQNQDINTKCIGLKKPDFYL